ncbi:aminotransferase class I/II-fold pyridoxal phosphate-dependent enzyme [Paenibacillus sp. PAMC21692]|nr:aminotransferase class I/II-fold pyridoxal phosphate-dependent enzyme [Paenibacillus sp. PAMC21692]
MEMSSLFIDLSTDARTMPTNKMWKAMQGIELSSVPFRGREVVEALMNKACDLTGQAAALLLPSCTMANLIAIMAHADRGDQVILEEGSHIAWSEGWGMASIAGVHPRMIKGQRGVIPNIDIIRAIEDERFSHKPRTKLLCLENTHNASGGTVLSQAYAAVICAAMRERGIAVHLDGARIFNAAVALKLPVRSITQMYDSVVFNLNKCLSAPEGAVLCGSAAFVKKAERLASALGGASQHKGDIMAAAGLIAIDEMVDGISDDHRRARQFAQSIQDIPGIKIDLNTVQTNIVMADISESGLDAAQLLRRLKQQGVAAYLYNQKIVRFVFHRHIGDEDAAKAAASLEKVISLA